MDREATSEDVSAPDARRPRRSLAQKLSDSRKLSYAQTFDSWYRSATIRAIEWMTGKIKIVRLYQKFMREGDRQDQGFWTSVLDTMGIEVTTPEEQFANIPRTGPVVVVGNHPHGLVDGIVFAELIGRVRTDYKVLTRALLTEIHEYAASFMISVPFPHDAEAQRKMITMRNEAMAQLKDGGVIALFPSGVVASSETASGPAIEQEWNVFTAKMIKRSGATIVPIFFPGSNSRAYQIANRISPTLRQSLLLHEIAHACDKPQRPVIGRAIRPEDWADKADDPRGFMRWLRAHTLALAEG